MKTMPYTYTAFGLSIESEVELPALMPLFDREMPMVRIRLGRVPDKTVRPPNQSFAFTHINENELLFTVPRIARYYVRNGREVSIEPLGLDWSNVLLYFYSNCLAAVLYQRNQIPFHVSGVLIATNRALLFAAPSGTGKSTTAVMLEQRGYPAFTDDTAVLQENGGKWYARASYPMIRLWERSAVFQEVYSHDTRQVVRKEGAVEKYGFHFHEKFITRPVEVAGIVFLEEGGNHIVINKISPVRALPLLGNNIYRNDWMEGMKKHVLSFHTLTGIVNNLSLWSAVRPENKDTFQDFAAAIEDRVICRGDC